MTFHVSGHSANGKVDAGALLRRHHFLSPRVTPSIVANMQPAGTGRPPWTRRNVVFLGVVPSPYQCDLLSALRDGPLPDLRVFWLEKSADDSPWPERERAMGDRVLSGFCIGRGRVRSHLNITPEWGPDPLVILNTSLTDLTTQWLLRAGLRRGSWVFWGEEQSTGPAQDLLARPLARSAGIMAVGPRAAADYARRFPRLPVADVPYHCSLDAFRARPARPGTRDEVVFLFCGQMIVRKGIDVLLEAFDRLVAAGLPVRLVLAGRPDAEGITALQRLPAVARQRIDNRGFVDPAGLPDVFSGADVLVLPSRREGWGVVVNQALGAGLPVIASDAVGAAAAMVRPGDNGWHVAAGDAASLAAAMRESVAHPAALAAMGRASTEAAVDWSPARGAEKIMEFLGRLRP